MLIYAYYEEILFFLPSWKFFFFFEDPKATSTRVDGQIKSSLLNPFSDEKNLECVLIARISGADLNLFQFHGHWIRKLE